jgi:4-hydroxybenzoate polyprenyltransferase
MMPSPAGPLWKRIGEESLWGRRGLIKANLLWLPLAVLLFQKLPGGLPGVAGLIFPIIFAVVFWLSASILANNLGDCRDDRVAGKQRWVCDIPRGAGAIVVVFLICAGLAVVFLSGSNAAARWTYSGAVTLALAYSLWPFRLKEKGPLGIFSYSLACACAYAVFPWAWMKGDWFTLLVLAPAILLDKWVNLHFHQVVDYEVDRERGIQTLAVRVGVMRARRWLRGIALLASLWLLLAWLYGVTFLPRPLGYIVLGAAALVLLADVFAIPRRSQLVSRLSLTRELPAYYLVETYVVFRLMPLLLFFVLALREKQLWAVFGVSFVLVALESWNLRRD